MLLWTYSSSKVLSLDKEVGMVEILLLSIELLFFEFVIFNI